MDEVPISEQQWKQQLNPEQYRVLRQKGTEAPFSGEYEQHWKVGTYLCAGCGQQLFASDTKFDAGCGWPSFDQAIKGAVDFHEDQSHGMIRSEVTCSRCGGHLGHVFPDGPKGNLPSGRQATGERFCINSVSMRFQPAESSKKRVS